MAGVTARVYGSALFGAAKESGRLDGLLEEAQAVREGMLADCRLLELIGHPGISGSEKLAFIRTVLRGRVSPEMEGFVCLMTEKGRYREIAEALDDFEERVLKEKKIGVAWVCSPAELTPEQKSAVTGRLLELTSYQSFRMNYSVDPELIGGLKIRIGDRVIDSSLKTGLLRLRRTLMETPLFQAGQEEEKEGAEQP